MQAKGFASDIFLLVAAGFLICAGACNALQVRPTAPAPATIPPPDRSAVALSQCLPAGVKLSDEVGMKNTTDPSGHILESTPITLQEKLVELNAVCRSDRTLTDATGKKIDLYSDTACWQGVAPANSQELLAKQSNEVKALEQSYIVIEIPCNGFVPIPP